MRTCSTSMSWPSQATICPVLTESKNSGSRCSSASNRRQRRRWAIDSPRASDSATWGVTTGAERGHGFSSSRRVRSLASLASVLVACGTHHHQCNLPCAHLHRQAAVADDVDGAQAAHRHRQLVRCGGCAAADGVDHHSQRGGHHHCACHLRCAMMDGEEGCWVSSRLVLLAAGTQVHQACQLPAGRQALRRAFNSR